MLGVITSSVVLGVKLDDRKAGALLVSLTAFVCFPNTLMVPLWSDMVTRSAAWALVVIAQRTVSSTGRPAFLEGAKTVCGLRDCWAGTSAQKRVQGIAGFFCGATATALG